MAITRHASRRALAAIATVAVALAGCGGSDDDRPNTDSAQAGLDRRIEAAEKQAKAKPTDPRPLAELAKAHFQAAGLKTNSTGAYTDEGKDELREATKAWDRYVALDPEPLDTGVAQLIVAAYGPGSLEQPRKAVDVQQVLTSNSRPPRASQYAQLAQMAYSAGEVGTAKAAADRAIALSPQSARTSMRKLLASARQLRPSQTQP
jgi:tetratricopeptide (TPR) repeat protein